MELTPEEKYMILTALSKEAANLSHSSLANSGEVAELNRKQSDKYWKLCNDLDHKWFPETKRPA